MSRWALLATPWYRHPDRVAYNLVFVAAIAAAAAIVLVVDLLSRNGRRVLASGVAVALGAAAALPAAQLAKHFRPVVAATTPVDAPEVAAFHYLRRHVRPGDRVLNDEFREGSAWMYTYDEVMPVFQLQPIDWVLWGERQWLGSNITAVGIDPKVDHLVDKFGVRYVYYGEQVFFDGEHRRMELEALRSAPHLREVFHDRTAHVFEVR
jgi:hypothetical protein